MRKPPDLIGHISLSLNLGSFSDAKDVIPVQPVASFHRMKDAKARDGHEVMMMLPVQVETPGGIPCAYDYPEDEFQRDYSFFIQPAVNGASRASSARVAELEADIQDPRERLRKAKGINDVMWEMVVQKVMVQERQNIVAESQKGTTSVASTEEPVDEDDVERPRKKGKKTETKKYTVSQSICSSKMLACPVHLSGNMKVMHSLVGFNPPTHDVHMYPRPKFSP